MSPFRHNSTGVDPDQKFPLLEKGWYKLRIENATETTAKKSGLPMVKMECRVSEGASAGQKLFHNVVFIQKGQKGEGMSVHFRKCIGVAYGGDDVVDAMEWIGKYFMAYVIQDEYEGKKQNKISEVRALEGAKEEDVPF